MNDWQRDTLQDYQQKGFAARMGYGIKPVLLVVDFINGFTDPESPLGGDFSAELAVTQQLQAEFRQRHLPILYTTVVYQNDLRDAGLFIKKVPSLAILTRGSTNILVDARIQPQFDEKVIEKKYASVFFDTELDGYLRGLTVDTVVMVGCTTSGCIRASAIDAMQYGYHTIVVRDGVGDRATGPHEANLFDIDAKYGDVITARQVMDYLASLSNSAQPALAKGNGRRYADFQHWWNNGHGNTSHE